MKSQQGQSMTEFAAGAAAMSLLLLGVLALGGYQEVDRRGVFAARQSAWEQGWSRGLPDSGAGATAAALHALHFSDSGTLDPQGRRQQVAEEDLKLQSATGALTGMAGVAGQAMLTPLRTASGFLGGGFDLTPGGMVQGEVQLRIAPITTLPEPFRSLELRLQARHALLVDAWHAAGVGHVRQRAGGLVPASGLRALNAVWQPLSVPLGILEPALRRLCIGLIEPDRIPEDRLGPGRTTLPEACP